MVKNRRSNDLGDIRALYVHPKSYCGNDNSESTLRTAKLTDDVFFGGIISNVCKHVDYIPNNAFQKEKCF